MKEDERARVLVIDDDEDIRRLVRKALDRESYKLLETDCSIPVVPLYPFQRKKKRVNWSIS